MLKWLVIVLLAAVAYGHPGVYDEYTYDDDKEGEGDGDYYLYYDEDESEESDIDDEELKKITDMIAQTSDEEDKPQKAGNGGPKKNRPGKNKQRSKRSASQEDAIPREKGAAEMINRKALQKHRDAAKAAANSRTKRFLDSILRPDKIILPIIKEVFKQHPRPLTKEQRDKISGGFFGWQYAMLSENCCSCKDDNTCSCCPSTNITGSDCVKFLAEPNRAQVSIDIGTHRHMEITVTKNSRSMSCEHANLKDICIYSDSFTPSANGYKACAIITNNVKDPKHGVLKCINYENGKSTISDS